MTSATEPSGAILLPDGLRQILLTALESSFVAKEQRFQRMQATILKPHLLVSLRLRDGTIKRLVEVNRSGEVVSELYEEIDHGRCEAFGPPRFLTEDIESWGYTKSLWRPRWNEWSRHIGKWVIMANANRVSPAGAQ